MSNALEEVMDEAIDAEMPKRVLEKLEECRRCM